MNHVGWTSNRNGTHYVSAAEMCSAIQRHGGIHLVYTAENSKLNYPMRHVIPGIPLGVMFWAIWPIVIVDIHWCHPTQGQDIAWLKNCTCLQEYLIICTCLHHAYSASHTPNAWCENTFCHNYSFMVCGCYSLMVFGWQLQLRGTGSCVWVQVFSLWDVRWDYTISLPVQP